MTTHVSGKVLRITDLTITTHVIRDHQFEDCLIIGPAVLALTGESSLIDCTFDGEMDALLWEIPSTRPYVTGAIQVDGSTFTRCRFQLIGFAGPQAFVDKFRAGTAGD
ncbi:hypothetical protein SAMN04487912_102324 [Arthrobacter sp. cf158]|uniref:hypothetical protein n=1 Tax=Arthrobacter sp. cf158 TaxID=1761744 RepID=UPI000896E289|nr:hypothetical protein [Arthrobacter sp. cf158]SDW32378.1 hypothetical protein SAMN04487912_102324 [Arthrobacter sp. cf158]